MMLLELDAIVDLVQCAIHNRIFALMISNEKFMF